MGEWSWEKGSQQGETYDCLARLNYQQRESRNSSREELPRQPWAREKVLGVWGGQDIPELNGLSMGEEAETEGEGEGGKVREEGEGREKREGGKEREGELEK